MSYIVFYVQNLLLRQGDNSMERKNGTHMCAHSTVCEHADVTVTWNHGVHTENLWKTGYM